MRISDWSSDVCSSDLIELLRAHEPAVVTLDLGLPPDPDGTAEGFQTLQEILSLKPDTKVIVASGHGARESALRAIADGAVGRASWRDRVCENVEISVVDASLKKKIPQHHNRNN